MSNPTLTKNFTFGAAATKARIIKFGAADATVVQASAATDFLIGVVAELDVASGARGDGHVAGLVPVEYGGNVTRGAPLTADANGKAVVAAPAAGSNVRIIGFAWVSGADGDIGTALLSPGVMQG